MIELLSPCNDKETMYAAVYAGADAVYFGGRSFNARMNAKNFTNDDIVSSIEFCHSRGVRVYITVNTQIYDRDMKEALDFVGFLYKAGADAIIATDLGLISLVREYLPDLDIHASTQLMGHNVDATEFLSGLGVKRMVAARELSGEEIRYLAKNGKTDIEMFIHGAICASQSGGCLMSSVIGGRSGNRGECAQPCRMQYNSSYPLSLKDMCLAGHITEIQDLGVKSLKIEGRMKNPSYVFAVVSTYRDLLDENRNATEEEIRYLSKIFSRDGFTDGYFTGKKNDMLGVRKEGQPIPSVDIFDRKIKKEKIVLKDRTYNIPDKIPSPSTGEKGKAINTARYYHNMSRYNSYFNINYLPCDRFVPGANGIFLPPVIKDRDMKKVREEIEYAKNNGARHILFENIGQIKIALSSGLELHTDYRFNIYNSYMASMLAKYGEVILSPELTAVRMRDIKENKGAIVYGKLPVMTLCVPVPGKLTDRRRVTFDVIKEGKNSLVLNSVPVYMADREEDIDLAGISDRHFIFTTENEKQIDEIIGMYKRKEPYKKGGMTRIKKK